MNQKESHAKLLFSTEENYFNFAREELIDLIRCGNNKVLEIGCGTGNTGFFIKDKGKAEEVVGIEIIPEVAKIAEAKIDKVICGNIEELDLPYKEYFDYVIAGDVLEHLYNPWEVVKKLKKYLKKEGYIIASIPNIRNQRILRHLIFEGRWNYTKAGLLDGTHLRFFTRSSIMELFRNNGFDNIEIMPEFKIKSRRKIKYNLINIFTFRLFEDFLTQQYIVKAKKL